MSFIKFLEKNLSNEVKDQLDDIAKSINQKDRTIKKLQKDNKKMFETIKEKNTLIVQLKECGPTQRLILKPYIDEIKELQKEKQDWINDSRDKKDTIDNLVRINNQMKNCLSCEHWKANKFCELNTIGKRECKTNNLLHWKLMEMKTMRGTGIND